MSVNMFLGNVCDQSGHSVGTSSAIFLPMDGVSRMSPTPGTQVCRARRRKSSTGLTCLMHMDLAIIGATKELSRPKWTVWACPPSHISRATPN